MQKKSEIEWYRTDEMKLDYWISLDPGPLLLVSDGQDNITAAIPTRRSGFKFGLDEPAFGDFTFRDVIAQGQPPVSFQIRLWAYFPQAPKA